MACPGAQNLLCTATLHLPILQLPQPAAAYDMACLCVLQDWRQDVHTQQEWASLLWQCLACQLQLHSLFEAVHADQTIKNVMSAAVPVDSYVTYRSGAICIVPMHCIA